MINLICNIKQNNKASAQFVGKVISMKAAIFWNANIFYAISASNIGRQFQSNVYFVINHPQLYSLSFTVLPGL
jgi:hypothetical protein